MNLAGAQTLAPPLGITIALQQWVVVSWNADQSINRRWLHAFGKIIGVSKPNENIASFDELIKKVVIRRSVRHSPVDNESAIRFTKVSTKSADLGSAFTSLEYVLKKRMKDSKERHNSDQWYTGNKSAPRHIPLKNAATFT